MRRHLLSLFGLLAGLTLIADEPVGQFPRIKPLEPKEALKSFELPPGMRIELVASEPMIRSPVAMEFDENGRCYVCEYPEYNQQNNPESKERGCVKLLEDTDGDGVFDKATVFVDDLPTPCSLACWDGGVFIGAPPHIWYCKDTTGTGKADIKRKVLTGFDRDKAGEAMMNSFRWTLDNRILISTGHAGGRIGRADQPNARPVTVRKQNIKLDPRTGDFTLTSGGGQHGLTMDDWGDVFTCDNSNPFFHFAYDTAYLAHNPYVEAPSLMIDVNAAGKHAGLHKISPPEPWRVMRTEMRRNKQFAGSDEGGQPFGHFTGATGVTVYRGDAWPAEYMGNIFIGEVANNLVYRARLERTGLTWTCVRADKDKEFLASRDVWFRPVQFANAPDGTLYVIDMYRELIETVESMPPSLVKQVGVTGGIGRGRIYRIVPDNFQQPKPIRLGYATTAELVKQLESSNGWRRDTAARLIYQRQDHAAFAPLRDLFDNSRYSLARVHAGYALQGLRALPQASAVGCLQEADPHLVLHAERWCETPTTAATALKLLRELATHRDERVRQQLAYSLCRYAGADKVAALCALVKSDGDNRFMRLAIECSAHNVRIELLTVLLAETALKTRPAGKKTMESLAIQVLTANKSSEVARLGKLLDQTPTADMDLIRGIVRAAANKPAIRSMPGLRAAALLDETMKDARRTAARDLAGAKERIAALRVIHRLPFDSIEPIAKDCLSVQRPPSVQTAALELLSRYDNAAVPTLIFAAWPSMSPAIRATATETLFARPAWINQFLDAVKSGAIRPADVDPARIQLLRHGPDEPLRKRVDSLFRGSVLSQRKDVLTQYQRALKLTGDAVKGKTVFKNVCSTCHKLDNFGTAVGPDLTTIKNHTPESVFINILDPNREVLPKYYTYQLTTDAGVTITGLITDETATSVTIRRADGTSAAVQRVNIEQLSSTGLSAMPEGLEKQIDVPAMADLIAYLLARN